MSPFSALVRKEAREHHAALWAIAAITAAAAIVPQTLPLGWLTGPRSFDVLVGAFGALAAMLTLAPGLLAAEASGDGLRFLARLPLRPATILRAKVAFLSASVAGAMIFGVLVAAAVRGVVVKAVTSSGSMTGSDTAVLLTATAAILMLGAWPLAVSCWVPRSVATIPAAAVVVAAAALPVWLTLHVPYVELGRADFWILGLVALLAPAISTWVSVKGALRDGGAMKRSARLGACAMLVLLLPAWAWAGWRRHDADVVDLRDPDVEIFDAWLSPDMTRAYACAAKAHHGYAVEIDLLTGRSQQVGGCDSAYGGLGYAAGAWSPMLRRTDIVMRSDSLGATAPAAPVLIDCTRGTVKGPMPQGPPTQSMPELVRADLRATTPLRDAQGHRIWVFGDRLERETVGGGFELVQALPGGGPAWRVQGGTLRSTGQLGLAEGATPGFAIELLTAAPLKLPPTLRPDHISKSIATPRGWLLQERGNDPGRGGWTFFHVATETMSRVGGLTATDRVVCALDDARVLVSRVDLTDMAHGTLETFDLVREVFEPVRDDHDQPVSCLCVGHAMNFGEVPLRTADGGWVLRILTGDGITLAHFDPHRGVMTRARGDTVPATSVADDVLRVLALDADGAVVVLALRHRIERLRFGSDCRDVLFPRD